MLSARGTKAGSVWVHLANHSPAKIFSHVWKRWIPQSWFSISNTYSGCLTTMHLGLLWSNKHFQSGKANSSRIHQPFFKYRLQLPWSRRQIHLIPATDKCYGYNWHRNTKTEHTQGTQWSTQTCALKLCATAYVDRREAPPRLPLGWSRRTVERIYFAQLLQETWTPEMQWQHLLGLQRPLTVAQMNMPDNEWQTFATHQEMLTGLSFPDSLIFLRYVRQAK